LPSRVVSVTLQELGWRNGWGRIRLTGVCAVKLPLAVRVALPLVQVIDQVTVTCWAGREVAWARMMPGWTMVAVTLQLAWAPEARQAAIVVGVPLAQAGPALIAADPITASTMMSLRMRVLSRRARRAG